MGRSEFPEREDNRFGQEISNPMQATLPERQNEPYERSMRRFSERSERNDWRQNNAEAAQVQRFARALGWFSIGLGMTELAAPRTIARITGMNGNRGLIRALGVREIASGVGILSRRKPVGWLWSRVFGDIVDLVVLSKAAASPHANRLRLAAAAAAVGGVTVLDFKSSQELTRVADSIEHEPIHVKKSIMIRRPAAEIYSFWRDFENLPQVMRHLESVDVTGDKRSRWVANGPCRQARPVGS